MLIGVKKLEIENNVLAERLSLMNSQVYSSSKSFKGIDPKKSCRGKYDDTDDFDGSLQSPVPTEEACGVTSRKQVSKEVKGMPEKKHDLPQADLSSTSRITAESRWGGSHLIKL